MKKEDVAQHDPVRCVFNIPCIPWFQNPKNSAIVPGADGPAQVTCPIAVRLRAFSLLFQYVVATLLFGIWDLELEIYLIFGICYLEFSCTLPFGGSKRPIPAGARLSLTAMGARGAESRQPGFDHPFLNGVFRGKHETSLGGCSASIGLDLKDRQFMAG